MKINTFTIPTLWYHIDQLTHPMFSFSSTLEVIPRLYPKNLGFVRVFIHTIPSKEEPAISLSIIKTKAHLQLLYTLVHVMCMLPWSPVAHSMHVAMIIGMLNTWHYRSMKIPSGIAVRGENGTLVTGKGKFVGVLKFYSLPLTKVQCFLYIICICIYIYLFI